jgi:hypothetical protein
MDLFGFKKRAAEKAAKKIEIQRIKEIELREGKKVKELHFEAIKKEYQILKDRAQKIADEKDTRDHADYDKTNSTCPNCNSKNVNERIQRLQGEFKGSISGGGNLFGASIYGHSSGLIDTNEINKCNDCGNEWKKSERKWHYQRTELENQFCHMRLVLDKYHEAFNAKIDKNDLDEKYSSDKEKRAAILNEIEKSWFSWKKDVLDFFKDITIETIKTVAEKELWEYDRLEKEWFWKAWDEKIVEEHLGLKHLSI